MRVLPTPVLLRPLVSPDGQRWAFGSQRDQMGLWVGPFGQLPEQIFHGRVRELAWEPKGQHLLFFSSEGLYTAQGVGLTPSLAVERLQGVETSWVWP